MTDQIRIALDAYDALEAHVMGCPTCTTAWEGDEEVWELCAAGRVLCETWIKARLNA